MAPRSLRSLVEHGGRPWERGERRPDQGDLTRFVRCVCAEAQATAR